MSTATALHRARYEPASYGDSPALRLLPTTVPPGPPVPARPALRVLEGGRAPAGLARQATFRRRRRAALVLLGVTVAVLVLLASAISARLAGGGHPSSAAGASSPASAVAAARPGWLLRRVVVRPGDTLWSIAAAVAPDADVRITVDRLVARNGESPIVVGPAPRAPLGPLSAARRALTLRACGVRPVGPSMTRSSTRARPTTARRSAAAARASRAPAASPRSSASRRRPSWS